MTATEKMKIQDRRRGLLAQVIGQVQLRGFCEVNPYAGIHHYDDPPEHWLVESARVFEEAAASREGRRPHLEAPRTFMGELEKECLGRGWNIEFNPRTMCHMVIAPEREVECAGCRGLGRVTERCSIHHYSPDQIVESVTCLLCNGKGKVKTR